MKRLLSLSTTILFTFTVFFVQIHQVFAQPQTDAFRQQQVGTPTRQQSPLSSICTDVAALVTGMQFTPEASQAPNEIVVLLTERIDRDDASWSCSQVIECLRIFTRDEMAKESSENITSASAEFFEITALKKFFPECIITGKDGLDLLNNYATLVYQWIASIVGSICILVIIVSGIQISIGGLSQEEVSAAKDRISRSLIGMVVLFLSAFILYSINPIFFT